MPSRVVILSDLHLGRTRGGAGSAAMLRPLWAGTDRLVVNGDVAEIHHPRSWRAAAREVLALHEACEQDGVELTLLSGNHDPFLSDHRHLHLAGGRVLVTHGDALHPAVAPWSPAAGRMRRAHDEAMAAFEVPQRDGLEARLVASQHASFAEWAEPERLEAETRLPALLHTALRPWLAWRIIRFWRVYPHLAAEFAERHAPASRVVVVGHSHRASVRTIGGRLVIDTGAYGFPGRPRAVVLEGGRLAVRAVRRRGGLWRLADDAIATFDLDAPALHAAGDAARAA